MVSVCLKSPVMGVNRGGPGRASGIRKVQIDAGDAAPFGSESIGQMITNEATRASDDAGRRHDVTRFRPSTRTT